MSIPLRDYDFVWAEAQARAAVDVDANTTDNAGLVCDDILGQCGPPR